MESYEYALPVEHWWQVLVNVSPKDLCNVVLTSKHMNTVASLPQLWAGMKFVNRAKMRENGLTEFYNINRFKKVKEISFDGLYLHREELERLLKEIPGSPLENANFGFTDLSGVSAEILASVVSHLRIVNLCATRLTTEQTVALLKASLSCTSLTNVDLEHVILSGVPAELLANSISRLQVVNLGDSYLTTEQCVALLKASLSSATLTNVDLWRVHLSEVPAELLANSIRRLQIVNLTATDLTTEQCVTLLNTIRSSKTLTIKAGYGDNVNLSEVTAELLEKQCENCEYCTAGSIKPNKKTKPKNYSWP